MVNITRRRFLVVTGDSLAGSSLALMGFSPSAALDPLLSTAGEVR
jgi:formate dehydrogenase major subunit